MSLEILTRDEIKSIDWNIFCVNIGDNSLNFRAKSKDNKHLVKFTTDYPVSFLSVINKVSPEQVTDENLHDYLSGKRVQLHVAPKGVMVYIGFTTGVYLNLKSKTSVSRNY